jgi:complement component 1 Q subcomponent-binding protein
VTVKFNVTNTVDATDSDHEADLEAAAQQQLGGEASQPSAQLKSRPTFTIDINRGGQTLSFLCSYLPHDHLNTPEQGRSGENAQQRGGHENENEQLEDFQIDEFAIHDGEWNEKVYSADCAVIDGELYDKLLNILEEHGIGEG